MAFPESRVSALRFSKYLRHGVEPEAAGSTSSLGFHKLFMSRCFIQRPRTEKGHQRDILTSFPSVEEIPGSTCQPDVVDKDKWQCQKHG